MMSASAMHYPPRIEERFLEELLAAWQAGQPRMGALALLLEAGRRREAGRRGNVTRGRQHP